MRSWLQVVGVFLLAAAHQSAAVGEVGKGPNDCYAFMPSDLPITISYSTSSNSSATSFTFLVNVRNEKVTAFGIRLKDDLASMPRRLSGIPEGQLIPQGSAFLWKISRTGPQIYTFVLNTTGLTEGSGLNSLPDLTDLCAQGIQVADDEGNLIWQQERPGSSCVSWVQQGDECSYQTFRQHAGVSLSPRLHLPMSYASPAPVVYGYGASSSPQAYGGYYSYASSFTPSPTPAPQLFGIQPTPAAYSPSAASSPRSSPYSSAPMAPPRPSASGPAPVPYYGGYSARASSATLFGGAMVSSTAVGSPYASPAAYGAAPYSPASSPSASPYYGLSATGSYGPAAYSSPSRALLTLDSTPSVASTHLFGARRLLSTLPLVNKLVAPTCNLIGQQAEPACVQQGKCAQCFERRTSDIGLQAELSMVYNGAANQTSLTLIIAATNTSMSTLDSVSLRVSQSLLSSQLEPDTVDSKLLIPEQQTTLHSSCDANGLQSSVEFSQVALTAGKATIEVHCPGEVEPFQDDVFVVNGAGETTLLAEAGTAVMTVRAADECYFQTMSV